MLMDQMDAVDLLMGRRALAMDSAMDYSIFLRSQSRELRRMALLASRLALRRGLGMLFLSLPRVRIPCHSSRANY
jgi:hypothetical protein